MKLVVVLIALMSFGSLLRQTAVVASADTTLQAADTSTPSSDQQEIEVPRLRTRNSRTYYANGRYTAHISAQPVNFHDASGWTPIDDGLVASTASGFAYQNKANDYTVFLPTDLSQPIRVKTQAGWIQFTVHGLSGTGTVSGNTDTFAFSGGAIAFAAEASGLKETITLNHAPASPTFTYGVQTSSGLTAKQEAEGGISFVDGSGTAQFTIPAPTVQDAASDTAATNPVSMALSADASSISVTVDPAWLNDPSRQWPVAIDPSIDVEEATDSCFIAASTPTTSNCTSPYLTIGYQSNALVQFDLSDLPSDATVQLAQLDLSISSGTLFPVGVYAAASPWSNPTWNSRDGVHNWLAPGGDYIASPSSSASPNQYAVVTWDTTQIVENWLGGTWLNNGFLLRDNQQGVSDSASYCSIYCTDFSGITPELDITYTAPMHDSPAAPTVGDSLSDTLGYSVDLSSGNLSVSQQAFSIPGIGLPVSIGQTFNSFGGSFQPDVGNGWTLSAGTDVNVAGYPDGSAMYIDAVGNGWLFTGTGSLSSPGSDQVLTESGGIYTLTDKQSGDATQFTSAGYQAFVMDRAGNKISDTYTTNPTTHHTILSSLTDTQGRTTAFTHAAPFSGDYISQITDPAGRKYTYAYDTKGNLTAYTDPAAGQTQFAYNTSGQMTTITDPDGNVTAIAYNTDGTVATITRLSTPTSQTGLKTTFTYGLNGGSCTGVTTPKSLMTTYCYDTNGNQTSVTTPLGHTTSWQYNSDNHVTKQTTAAGRVTDTTYATNGLVNKVTTDALSTSMTYNVAGQPYVPDTATDDQGNVTTFGYNGQGIETGVTDALSHSTTYGRNGNGTLSSVTDANNHTTFYGYYTSGTSIGLLETETPPAPLGATTTVYTTANQVAQVTDGNGNTSTYSYDGDGRVKIQGWIDASGSSAGSIIYTYDKDGNVLTKLDNTGTTTYTYDVYNRLTKETDPDGTSTAYGYDGDGNLLSRADPFQTTSYSYDSDDQLASASTSSFGRTTFGYDNDGNQTSVTYPNGVVESTGYDGADLLTSIGAQTSGGTTLTNFAYSYLDPLGRSTSERQSVTDASGTTTAYTYDAANRLTNAVQTDSTDQQMASDAYGYDPVGNMTSQTINGTQTTMTYNDANELTAANGSAFTYDAAGNVLSDASARAFTINPRNQVTSITPSGGSAVPLSYRGAGQTQRMANGGTSYQYSGSALTGLTDSGSDYAVTLKASATQVVGATAVTLTATASQDVTGTGTEIDIVNQSTGITVAQCLINTTCTAEVRGTSGTSATYVAKMTQTSTGTSLAQSVPVTVTSISASTGWTVSLTTTKTRVPLSTMVQVHAITNQTVSSTGYQIDLIDLSSGSTIKSCTIGTSCFIDVTEATAGTHTYLAKVETSTGSTVKAGSPIVTTTWSDETLFLTTPDGTVLGERVSGANDFYLHDALNSVVALVDSSGTIQNSYNYDPYGNVTTSTENVPNPFRYAGSIWDSQTGLYKMGVRYYDPSVGRFTQVDPMGGAGKSLYLYAGDNPANDIDPTGLQYEQASGGSVKLRAKGGPRNGRSVRYVRVRAKVTKMSHDHGGCDVIALVEATGGFVFGAIGFAGAILTAPETGGLSFVGYAAIAGGVFGTAVGYYEGAKCAINLEG